MSFLFDEGKIKITVPADIYSEAVVFKCLYWYTESFTCEVARSDDSFVIHMQPKGSPIASESATIIIEKIKGDLLDYKTREIIAKETTNIREMLIAKAFANGDMFEDDPPGSISDPVGFDPAEFSKNDHD